MNNSFATVAAALLVAMAIIDQVFWQGSGLVGAGRVTIGVISWLAFWR
jgi:hypothetical protein